MGLATVTVADLRDLLSERERAAAEIDFVEEVSPGGRYSRRPPIAMDMIELEADQRDLMASYLAHEVQDYASIRHVVLRNAMVTGQGSVITSNHQLIRESAAEFLAHNQTPTNLQSAHGGAFWINTESIRRVEAPSLLVKRPWYRNYGHWLVDGAALLTLAWKLDLPHNWQIAIGDLGPGTLRSIVHETMAALAPGVRAVEHPDEEVWQFRELHFISPLSVPPLFKFPESLNYLRATFLRAQLSEIRSHPGLFITRGTSPVRRLINEEQIAGICQAMGMTVFAPETVSLADQARLFRSARLVVGVKGASLTNAVFCAPSANVIALSPGDFPDPFFWDLVSQNNVGYSEVFGAIKQRSARQGCGAFSIDASTFIQVLERSIAADREIKSAQLQ